ncbi:DUF4439 domain-containing protein [Cellulosimicrobium cellulans]|uniref:DUF4439 domain-containing protein n=1 Tax=Cellulosimicrobium cellulans TaxID=1710 RepID=UPI001BA6EDEF|nr:DUF4439 domain-containing protein [Cellulosimicrobium cellulans]QUC01075.1 DUF4439 domain-containing protein [Cellulosimicrobium cellulans]
MTPHATAADAAPRARRTRPAARARRLLAVVTVLATGVLAAGCGVRLDTPAPTEPSPDTVEVLRSGAVDDALAVAALVADVTPRVTDPAALAVLGEAAAFAEQHVDALGGVYDSGLEDPAEPEDDVAGEAGTDAPGTGTAAPGTDGTTSDPGSTGTSTGTSTEASTDTAGTPAPGTATTDDVVTALVGAAERTGAAADASPDARLARLLASVAASEHVSAQRLAAATGSTAAAGLAEPPPVDEAPGGVGAADLATLVEAEDAAGYGYEVRAAQSEGDVRTAAVARAAQHRARAQGWALAAGTDGTPQDPRRVAYALPDGTDAAALARQVESGLAQTYASLAAAAAPTSRAEAVALLADAWASAVAWGEAPVAFPGLPEQTAG